MTVKIGIVGNYGNNNKGDEAILEGIIQQLDEALNITRDDIVVFSNTPDYMREEFGVEAKRLYYKKGGKVQTFLHTMKQNKPVIASLDLLIIGGGGIFMDLYGTESFLFGLYGEMAKQTKTKAVLYGVGAGPIKTKLGAFILKRLANQMALVTVRDDQSKALMREIGVKQDIHVIGDPAFKIGYQEEEVQRHERVRSIAITAVPYYHGSYWPEEDLTRYNDYVDGMARNIELLLVKYPEVHIDFYSTKQPQDTDVTEDIYNRLKNQMNVTVHRDSFDAKDLVSFAEKHDVVIGTRLHSLILALVARRPIVAIGYHHKVTDFMNMLGLNNQVIDIEELHLQDDYFERTIKQLNDNWQAEEERFSQLSKEMKEKAMTGMTLIKEKVLSP